MGRRLRVTTLFPSLKKAVLFAVRLFFALKQSCYTINKETSNFRGGDYAKINTQFSANFSRSSGIATKITLVLVLSYVNNVFEASLFIAGDV